MFSGKVTPNPLIPKADAPNVCLLPSLPQTIANAGIGDAPLSSLVFPPKGPIGVGTVENNSGDEKNNPISSLMILSSKAEIEAGFHCRAPEISSGCAVAAPPIDMFTAPIPCII